MNKPNVAMQKAIETEKQVINIALYKKQAVSILAEIDSKEFFIDSFRKIKMIIDSMIADNKSISLTSVYNEIMDKKLQEEYIQFAADPLIIDPATAYDQFKKFHRLVNLQPKIEELLYMAESCNINFEDKFNELTEMYITSKVIQEATELSQLMKVDLKQIHEKYSRFKSGILSLDNKIKWLYGGQYICIAGAPGTGKSTMGINIAVNVPNSLIMSYEMSEEEIHNIVLSRHLSMDSEKIESGELNFNEQKAVDIARRELSEKLTLKVCDKPLYLNDLMAFIKSAVYRYGIKLVVIDYAQIIPGLKSSGNQTEKFEDMSRRFKLIARELKITVIALSGLTKDSLKEGRAPTLADLRGSLSFGADADKVIVLYEIPDETTMGKGTPQGSVIKNRKGRVGKLEGFHYNKAVHFIN